jgi:histidine phosphotransfer protein HptB
MISDFEGETPTDKFQQHTLQNYSDGDLDFEKDLIESYKQSISEHLPKLGEAFENDDLPESILHSHDIKGSSSYIGAEAVRWVSGKIEALCKQKNLKDAATHLPELQKEADEVFILLDKYMASLGVGDVASNTGGDDGGSNGVKDKIVEKDDKAQKDSKKSPTKD